jgi:diguanylate cyclase (GGDEF)-like protein
MTQSAKLARIATIVAFTAFAFGQTPPLWRFWDIRDGLVETFSQTLAVGPQGEVWSSHGESAWRISVNDGYGIRYVVSPGPDARVFVGPNDIWAVTSTGLWRMEKGSWIRHPIPRFDRGLKPGSAVGAVAVPQSPGEILLLTPELLLEYHAESREAVVLRTAVESATGRFINAIAAVDGGIWVSMEDGIAHLANSPGAGLRWEMHRSNTIGASGFRYLREYPPGVLTMTGQENGSTHQAVVRFDGEHWSVLLRAQTNAMRGWYDTGKALWIENNNRLVVRSGAKDLLVERKAALRGSYHDVLLENGTTFWVATVQGVGRHTEPMWNSPVADTPDETVSAIVEDRNGRIWYAGDDSLVCLNGARWKRYFVPEEFAIKSLRPGALMASSDGQIIFESSKGFLGSLDPKSGRIHRVQHPLGRHVAAADRTRDGNFSVLTLDRTSAAYFLEGFDGRAYTELESMGRIMDQYQYTDIRALLRDSRGVTWFGGAGQVVAHRGTGNIMLGAAQGYPGAGAFTVVEPEPGRILIGDVDKLLSFDGRVWTVLSTGIDRTRRIISSRDGTVWAASGSGVLRLRKGVLITNDAADGLPSDIAYTVFEDSKGRIWAGTSNGLSRYNPSADTDPPRTLISETQNQKQTPPNGEVTLRFSGVDRWKYTDASRLLFSYRLDRGPWSAFEPISIAAFHHLAPKAHRFEVKAMDRNGNVDPAGATFEFFVSLPWYLNSWFLVISSIGSVVIGGLLVLAVHNLRRFRLAKIAAESSARDMTHSSQHDFLTGLPNRVLLNDRIDQAIGFAKHHMKSVVVLFLDLDGFKHINDSLGHPIGDKLLQSVARRLGECVRATDTVSRQGGDEFVVLLTEVAHAEDAVISAKRMLQTVAEAHSINGHDLHVTTSIGLSVYPDDGVDAETLIKNADTAMYQSKENGRQSYQFFKPAMNARAVERQSIEESLRRALERQEFELHYQPKINLRTREITGAEALLRWTHPTRGLVPPAQFIPIAEDCGLILPIGNWVLREACKQARIWVDTGLPLPNIAVNISAMEFRAENFLGSVLAILADTGLDPGSLELELTESVLMKHVGATESVLQTLRARGVHLTVDDFGTGYSSLSYLRKFPIDALKIDQSFIRQITTVADGATIVAAVISMGRSLQLRVVAEGVETQEEVTFLQAHHCDEAQGYYFGRPLRPQQFAKLLETGISETVLT